MPSREPWWFVASFTVLPLFFLILWVVGVPFGTLCINPTFNGFILTGAGFDAVIGTINTLQGIPEGVGWLVGSIAAIPVWQQVPDRYF